MAEPTKPMRAASSALGVDPAAGTPQVDNLAFGEFSKAFDEVHEARKALEKYGTARLSNPPPPEVVAAQKAFVAAATRYNEIVAALIKPKF
jgi:hypothetical protein